MKNYYHKNLDAVLIELSSLTEKGFMPEYELEKLFSDKYSKAELILLLDFLVSRNLVSIEVIGVGVGCDIPHNHYKISLGGLVFLEKSSFSKEIRTQRLRKITAILKIIIITLNAIAILWLSYRDVVILDKTNKLENIIEQKGKIIDSLNIEIHKAKLPAPIK